MNEFRGQRLRSGDKVRLKNPEHFPELMEEHRVDPRRTFVVATAEVEHVRDAGRLEPYWHQMVTLMEVRGKFSVSNQNLVRETELVPI